MAYELDMIYCTAIDDTNRDLFKDMLSEYMWDETDLQFGIVDNTFGFATAAGIIAMSLEENYLELNYLYVAPCCRGIGCGKCAIEALFDVAKINKLPNVKCHVVDKEQEEFITFLKDMGFREDDDVEEIYSFEIKNLDMTFFEKFERITKLNRYNVVSLSSVSPKTWTKVVETNSNVRIKDRTYYDGESFVVCDHEGIPFGGVLIRSHDSSATIEYIWNNDNEHRTLMINCINEAIWRYKEKGRLPDEIVFVGLNRSVVDFVRKITGDMLKHEGYLREFSKY